jgi:pimeloyl-ACP methyl ester carboxylesterase
MHAQLLELLAYLGWSRVNLLGFSMGGSIAATFTACHPEVVESLILVAHGGLWRKAERGWWDGLIIDGGWGLEWLSVPRILDNIEGKPTPKPDWKERWIKGEASPAAVVKWQREEHRGHVAGVVSMWRHLLYDQHVEFGKLVGSAVKVLVVLGELDPVIETEATKRALEALGWKEKIEVIGGGTHEVVRSHAQEVADLAGELWESLSESS